MGRCNNRRAQQAAQQLRNTPSRARFSKPPPSLKNKGRKKKSNDGRGGGRGGRGGRHNAAVIDKLSKRVQEKSSQTATTRVTKGQGHVLDGVDVSKLDEVTLSDESVQLVTKLLTDLGVMEAPTSVEKHPYEEEKEDIMNEGEAETTSNKGHSALPHPQLGSSGYSEYEDDGKEIIESTASHGLDFEAGDSYDDDALEGGDGKEPIPTNKASESQDKSIEKLRGSELHLHLTQQLSFSESQADRACLAIENQWCVPKEQPNEVAADKSNGTDEMLGLAMDWLCLHLTEQELKDGFKPNPKMRMAKQKAGTRRIPLVAADKTRPIPHASISVAAPLTSDQEWRDAVQKQTRTVGFVRLGFHRHQAEKACDETKNTIDANNIPPAEKDETALRLLLSWLEQETMSLGNEKAPELTAADLDFAKEERQQEIQALEAIFDDAFQHLQTHCTVRIHPHSELEEPARTEECKLFIFERPGYPVLEAPLLLFSNPTLPPSLLRQIHVELIRQAHQAIGEPAVFALVDYLSNNLNALQKDFIRQQRTMEMEAEQLRLRREAGHNLDDLMEEQPESGDGKIGRRQRAKLKAAEISYDRDAQIERENEKRRVLQAKRIEQIQQQEKSHRYDLAEQTVQQRAKERIEEEAERASRAAMNAAFLRGQSADEARAAAQEARKQCLRDNGEVVSSSDDDSEDDASIEQPSAESNGVGSKASELNGESGNCNFDGDYENSNIQETVVNTNATSKGGPTPTTMAFMERLRQFYQDSAKQKTRRDEAIEAVSTQNGDGEPSFGEHPSRFMVQLTEPKAAVGASNDSRHEESEKSSHVPEPVAVPTGDLAKVFRDVIKVQTEQPWLISEEARAPTLESATCDLTPSQLREQEQVSDKLRKDLQRKYQSAEDWASKQQNIDLVLKNKTNAKNGKSPQQFYKMLSQRKRLPAYNMKEEIVETISSSQVTVISGDTGCGKTTQVPQLVLDDLITKNKGASANIIMTQPRRISAIGVAERVASERCERVGETAGYSIRLENKRTSKTRLLLCTTGILMRRLQCDPDLASVSHVFVDEVHERDINTDFLLIILKDLLERRKSLKLILMSATLNAESFSSFFSGCPVVSIPGRTYPVTENRLEDILQVTGYEVEEDSDYAVKLSPGKAPRWSKTALRKMYHPKYNPKVIDSLSKVDERVINYELLAELLEHITVNEKEGAILVFLPGMMEITKAIEEIYKKEVFTDPSRVVVYPLHSSLTTAEQTAVFDVPPDGVRKIVVSTNIAETSITIEDVVFVVDAGRVKENRQDEVNQMPTLVECWVSRASAKQRRGRAGRVQPGVSYHMYSSHTFEQDMDEYQLPEMLRVGLDDLVLQVLLLDLGEPSAFLAKALNPPSALAMKNSLKLLEGLGAVECEWGDSGAHQKRSAAQLAEEEEQPPSCSNLSVTSGLTALGFHLATLPVDPRVGKMMIYGAVFGCIDPALTIAASMSARNPFLSPFDRREEANAARQEFATENSDHLTTLTAFQQWKELRRTKGDRAASSFLRESFLSRMTLFQMDDLRRQFADLLVDIGFLPKNFRLYQGRKQRTTVANDNENNVALVKAVLCAGLYPNIVVAPRPLVSSGATASKGDKEAGECAFQSTKGEVYLHPCTVAFSSKSLESRYCCYHEIVKTSKTYVRDCTPVSEFAILLFGGSLKVYHTHGAVTVDDWLKFKIAAKPATLVKHLRAQMEVLLLKKIVSPEENVTGSPEGRAMIQSVSALLEREVVDKTGDGAADIVRPYHLSQQHDRRYRSRAGRGRQRNSRSQA